MMYTVINVIIIKATFVLLKITDIYLLVFNKASYVNSFMTASTVMLAASVLLLY